MKGIKMSVNEFKAWLNGYTQAKKELTADDIKVIQEKLNEIQDQVQFVPITYPVYPIEPYRPYWQDPITCDPFPYYTTTPNTCGDTGTLTNTGCDITLTTEAVLADHLIRYADVWEALGGN